MEQLEQKAYQYMKQYHLCNEGDRLLVACSGGVDSMALLHFLYKEKERLGVTVAAVHVNHMLRGVDAVGDRQFVEAFCSEHEIPIYAADIPIPQILQVEKGNLQAICRRERYQYFEQVMLESKSTHLVVAHHADDQIESVVMALTRGSNASGIAGIKRERPFANGHLIRPFLAVTKKDIHTYLQRNEQTYREDSSNKKDSYTRNRIRHHVVPLLEEENPRVADAVRHYTEKVQADEELLQSLAKDAFHDIVTKNNDDSWKLCIKTFQSKPLALQRRIILLLLKYLYKDTIIVQSYTLWNSILEQTALTAGNAILHLPKDVVAIRQYDELIIKKKQMPRVEKLPKMVILNTWTNLTNNLRVYIGKLSDERPSDAPPSAKTYFFQIELLSLPLSIRTRQNGDRINLLGLNHHKRLSRLFIDEKIPMALRDEWPVIVTQEDEVIALPGLRVSSYFSNNERSTDDAFFIVDQQTL
ncbi:tRNA lysidine(34) synthetase TilS [Viridibacillus sp. YIM B01967]|uniref:tRNA(Ile)-lysidine synthase n=1 Tax=Viridibacillus soli TaxID=2798301 RepID=A0ABS1HBX1_9BACL|nr:tRNA lysidine(34) synthetase TilS [Viridibacillus soli]MBK3496903.1 tRNA lysidine(34) synthetase TilS [Viridibacillus soli]